MINFIYSKDEKGVSKYFTPQENLSRHFPQPKQYLWIIWTSFYICFVIHIYTQYLLFLNSTGIGIIRKKCVIMRQQ